MKRFLAKQPNLVGTISTILVIGGPAIWMWFWLLLFGKKHAASILVAAFLSWIGSTLVWCNVVRRLEEE